jgi:ketol-acid reductoisomerase
MKIFSAEEISAAGLPAERIAVLGFGSQGRAQALNLRDSGVDVVVGLREESPRRDEAREAGFEVAGIGDAVGKAGIIAFLLPDERHGEVFGAIASRLRHGQALLFAHGFSVTYDLVVPPTGVDVIMVSPKGPGPQLRSEFEAGGGLVSLVAVHKDSTGEALRRAIAYAAAIGGHRRGILECTFREECETDLFGEQAVICGGLSHLVLAGYDILVAAGYPEEMAYFECLHEVKFVADLIQERGVAGMREAISNTAKYGDVTRGPRVIGPEVRNAMSMILEEIRSGDFARQWTGETAGGGEELRTLLDQGRKHPSERIGARLRALMKGGAS